MEKVHQHTLAAADGTVQVDTACSGRAAVLHAKLTVLQLLQRACGGRLHTVRPKPSGSDGRLVGLQYTFRLGQPSRPWTMQHGALRAAHKCADRNWSVTSQVSSMPAALQCAANQSARRWGHHDPFAASKALAAHSEVSLKRP
jgi:hypothetical protein